MLVFTLFCVVNFIATLLAKMIKSGNRVNDIIHNNFRKPKLPYVSDLLIFIQVLYFIGSIDEMINLYFLTLAITQLIRICCFTTTILPFLKNYDDKYRLGGINGSGTEYIFSGHAMYSAISTIHAIYKGSINLHFILWYNIVTQFIVIVTRNHYTVDIILGWVITTLVYGNLRLCSYNEHCNETIKFILW